MKFKTATGTNTVKPVKHKWAKVIATVEKHFELDELFA